MDFEQVEDLEVVETSENVEQTTEETVEEPAKLFTQEDLNAAVGKAKARARAKVEKEYERKYGSLMNTLKAGTGKETVEEVDDTFQKFYRGKGIKIAEMPAYSEEDIALLADADANEIISAGDAEDEFARLEKLGTGMSKREQETFRLLADHLHTTERGKALNAIGVTEDVYNSKEFKAFADMFKPSTPITEVYKQYAKTVKPNVEHIGSMKNGSHDDGKTFYTPEEVDKLTPKDLDNPVIFQRVRDSMKLWK